MKKKLQKPTEKNVRFNDDKTGYVLQMSHGKTRNYKRLSAAEGAASITRSYLSIPGIVTANTYFWNPAGSASGRRSAERRRQAEIDDFCAIVNKIPTIDVKGSYDESCNNVYKTMSYEVNGKSTNLTGLIGECARWNLILEK